MNYPMIPLRGLSIFPGMVLHFDIGREKSIKALEEAMEKDQHLFLVSQKEIDTELPTSEDFYHLGAVAKVKQMLKMPGDSIRVLVEGLRRAKITEILKDDDYFLCEVDEDIEIECQSQEKEEALKRMTLSAFDQYAALTKKMPEELVQIIESEENGGKLADGIAGYMNLTVAEKQSVLECLEPCERLEKIYSLINKELEVVKIENEINKKVKERMDQSQREYLLKEQMKVIQEELGFAEDTADEILEWHNKMNELEIEPDICEKLEKEIKRVSQMPPGSAEAGVIRTYVDTILSLPWNKASQQNHDLKSAEKILNNDHYGLEKVKERIVEYLAVTELSQELKGPILCLVGPPGTGKTSIAKSIARATGREYVRMSLGGVRDEAEIRGHRRTYVGAIPGRVINCIKEAGVNNPLFLFDEIDKLGSDFKGDPSSALLEVLDPEQNKTFTDHYLEVPFDLSKVMFITTANSLDTIPGPLLDRMEVIQVSGYTEQDKMQIAKKYLVPKKVEEHGLTKEQFALTDKTIHDLINHYTRESGVRNLEREIASLTRKVAKMIVTGEVESFKVKPSNLEDMLGKKKFRYDKVEGESEVGVVTGMAWTQVGGDTLYVETAVMPGTGKIELTGQLGDVMKESARIAIGYVRMVAEKHGIDTEFYKNKDIHIHFPEGAIPKDGPSAGVTMSVAIISALSGVPVRKDVAMTGEVTLRGKVLPVGGIKEKVLAAHRAGIKKILLPVENERDIDEIPEKVRTQLEFVLVKNVDDALKEALVK